MFTPVTPERATDGFGELLVLVGGELLSHAAQPALGDMITGERQKLAGEDFPSGTLDVADAG